MSPAAGSVSLWKNSELCALWHSEKLTLPKPESSQHRKKLEDDFHYNFTVNIGVGFVISLIWSNMMRRAEANLDSLL